ncbi:MAG: hypothetical protein KAJ19_17235 [Gammaproteobacteria bacterium]|nr:hypothetical protein [Gammaproteobacteria bacterium]
MARTYNPKTALYNAWRRYLAKSPYSKRAMEAALHPTIKGPRGGKQYVCSACGTCHGAGNVEIEHTKPVIPLSMSLERCSWDMIEQRMRGGELTVMCKTCHKAKSAAEATLRADWRRKPKHLVCRVKGGNRIEVITITDLKSKELDLWDILLACEDKESAFNLKGSMESF